MAQGIPGFSPPGDMLQLQLEPNAVVSNAAICAHSKGQQWPAALDLLRHWGWSGIGPSLRENRKHIMEYYDLRSDLIDFLDLGQKSYPIAKNIRLEMMRRTMTSFCVLTFWELDISSDPNQGNR